MEGLSSIPPELFFTVVPVVTQLLPPPFPNLCSQIHAEECWLFDLAESLYIFIRMKPFPRMLLVKITHTVLLPAF